MVGLASWHCAKNLWNCCTTCRTAPRGCSTWALTTSWAHGTRPARWLPTRIALSKGLHEAPYALWWKPHADAVVFALLLTPGQHAARQLEKLRDSGERNDRITLGDYELVQRPREGRASPAWTWRLTDEAYQGWRARVLEVVRTGNDYVVRQLIDDIMATPGFAGVREQVKKLKALLRAEWARRRGGQAAPELPRQRFVQRLENKGSRLNTLHSPPAEVTTPEGGRVDAQTPTGPASL